MDRAHLKGLLGSAAHHIARLPHHQEVLERLENVEDRESFRTFLEDVNLGLAEPATRFLIENATGDDWHQYKDDLTYAVDRSMTDRYSPSA